MHPIRGIRQALAAALVSNRLFERATIRFACDERVLMRTLESDLFVHRIRKNEDLFVTFKTLLTEDKLLHRLLKDANVNDKILLYEPFVHYAARCDLFLDKAAGVPALVNAVAQHQPAWDRLLQNEDLLRHAVTTPRAQAILPEVVHDAEVAASVVDAILASSETLDQIFSDEARVTKLVARAEIREALLDDPNWMSDPELLDRALANAVSLDPFENHPEQVERLVESEAFQERLMARPELLGALLRWPQVLQSVLEDQRLASRALEHETVFDALIHDEALLKKVLFHPRSFDLLLADEAQLTKILGSPRAFDVLLGDETQLTKVLSSPRAFDVLLGDETLLSKVLNSQRAFDRILADPVLLGRLINHGRTLETLSADGAVLNKLLSMDRVIEHAAQSPDALERMLSNGRIVTALRNAPNHMARILNHGAAIEGLAGYPEFVQQIARNNRVVAAILRSKPVAQRLITQNPDSERMASILEFAKLWEKLEPVVDTSRPGMDERLTEAAWNINHTNDVRNAAFDLICQDNTALLAHGKLRFTDRFSLWTVIHEILLNEEYYFDCDAPSPRILDCGANFGMAIYYFKALYPSARITAFEPVPAIRQLAEQNVELNGWTDVEILPYALAENDGTTTFYLSKEYPLAGTLTRRRHEMGDTIEETEVECRRLSPYLDEPVHFLKLDIEGSEDRVLEECSGKLHNIQNLFIEYHHGLGMEAGRLPRILSMLDDTGFEYHLQKSYHFATSGQTRALARIHEPYSLNLWARNLRWSPPTAAASIDTRTNDKRNEVL